MGENNKLISLQEFFMTNFEMKSKQGVSLPQQQQELCNNHTTFPYIISQVQYLCILVSHIKGLAVVPIKVLQAVTHYHAKWEQVMKDLWILDMVKDY